MDQFINKITKVYKILVVDDEEKHLKTLKNYLEQQGFSVSVEKSAEEGLNSLKTLKPDLIILDIIMSKMNGYQFVKEFQLIKTCSEIPFLFVTAKGMTQDRINGYAIGCSGYIPKPFDPEELIAIIKNILKRKETSRSNVHKIRKQLRSINGYLENKYSLFWVRSLQLKLTSRELSVLQFILQGSKNREIACNLNTGVRNIEKYVSRLLTKTNCRNRTDLVKFCYSNNIFLRANDGNRTRE